MSGLHTFLADDPVARGARRKRMVAPLPMLGGRRADLPVASGLARDVDALVVLTVGTDCNVGKMTAQLQLVQQLKRAASARDSWRRARPGS